MRLSPMNEYADRLRQLFDSVLADPRYQRNLDWGEPRPGHPEGTVRAHIEELELNLGAIRPFVTDETCWKLRILIHAHDTFKREATEGVAIADPRSHASRARAFLQEHGADDVLLMIAQYHDEPYALWRQFQNSGAYRLERFEHLLRSVTDWDLFRLFLLIDGTTDGKSEEPLTWFLNEVDGKVPSALDLAAIRSALGTRHSGC
jgi:hypothetical protein